MAFLRADLADIKLIDFNLDKYRERWIMNGSTQYWHMPGKLPCPNFLCSNMGLIMNSAWTGTLLAWRFSICWLFLTGLVISTARGQTPDSFNPGTDNALVNALVVQPDGKVVFAGSFNRAAGQPRVGIARVDGNGVLDPTFNPAPTNNCFVESLLLQPNGQIVVGGQFTQMGGEAHTNLARLNPDGTAESGFNPFLDSSVTAMALQADGKLIVGGWFNHVNGQPRTYLCRLNQNGTLDDSFAPEPDNLVFGLMVQPDGKILAGGYFLNLAGQPRSRIARLNGDGSLDADFNPGADAVVYSFALQSDSNILVCGDFFTIGGQARSHIARLFPSGTVDTTFNAGSGHPEYQPIFSMAPQADGKIVVGGIFTSVSGQPRNYVARLMGDGSADAAFNPGADWRIQAVGLQPDGKILAGGGFVQMGGQSRTNIGRFNNPDAATQMLVLNGTNLTWNRSGTTPEVRRTTFDYSADGMTWTNLGAGTRIPGGWSLNGISLPLAGTIRAQGENSGSLEGSAWWVESYLDLAPNVRIMPETVARTGPSSFSFTLTSPPAATLEILASSNLTQWSSLGLLTNQTGTVSFTDQTATASERTYRARMVP
jgi:uncharacterized delta-60 repeat protein